MKKLAIWILALALLVGCTVGGRLPAQEEDGGDSPPPAVQPVEPAITDISRFSRTEIIRRNESLEGFFLTARAWVHQYAADTWPGSEFAIEYLSGFVAPEAMFTDHLSGGATLWRVTVSQPDGQALDAEVQVIYFQEGEHVWLSGVLAGDQVLQTRPEVYDYLRLDTRFAARMCALPEIAPPEGMIGNSDVSALFGAENCSVALLERSVAALYDLNSGGEGRVTVMDLAAGRPLFEQTLEAGSWASDGVSDSVLSLTRYDADGGRTQVLYASAEGIELKTLYPEAAYRWPMGEGRFVESRNNSLYRITLDPATGAETSALLLEGVAAQDETGTRFAFRRAISEDQFIYDYWGYEWLNRSGVYDLSTGTDEHVSVPVTENGATRRADCAVLWADRDRLVAAVSDYGYYAFTVYDRAGKTQRTLDVGCGDAEHRAARAVVSPDGSRLLLTREPENGSRTDYAFELYDLRGSLLWSWSVNAGVVGDVSVAFADSATLAIDFYSLLTGSRHLYVVTA